MLMDTDTGKNMAAAGSITTVQRKDARTSVTVHTFMSTVIPVTAEVAT